MTSPQQQTVMVGGATVNRALIEHIKSLTALEFCAERKSERWKGKKQLLNTIYSKRKTFFLDYDSAVSTVREHKLANRAAYATWRKRAKFMHLFLPSRPDKVYKNRGWVNWKLYLKKV